MELEKDLGDVADATTLIKEIENQAFEIRGTVKTLSKRVKTGNFQSSKVTITIFLFNAIHDYNGMHSFQGLSFLEVKNQMLLSYLTNLTYLMYKKVNGQRIEGDSSIDRLVEIRTVLEKMRPIDQKLKYQIDKLLTSTATGKIDPDDPMRFKANPDNLSSKIEVEESEHEDDYDEKSHGRIKEDSFRSSKAYVPPKLSAMHYKGDETILDQRQKVLERAKKRALSSSIMQELRKEYDEGPEEVRESRDLQRLKEDKSTHKKTDYEEEFMMRLPITKQEKHKSRQVATMSSLAGITHFEDISALDREVDDIDLSSSSSKKKKITKKSTKKGKKGGFRKRKWK